MKHLVLLHGWAAHSGFWGDFATQLSLHYRVTLINLSWCDNLSEISDAVIAELDDEPFYVLGWSFGGTVALDIAARYSNRVKSVILLAANPCFVATETWEGMSLETFQTFAEQLHTNPTGTLSRFLALQCQGVPNAGEFLKGIKACSSTKITPNLSELETSLALLKTSDLRSVFANLTCPIAVILSDNDTLIPVSISESMQRVQPNLQLTVLQNSGHIPFITQPENCLNAIHVFLLNPLLKGGRGGFLDKTKIKQAFGNASHTYDSVAELQRNVGRDLLCSFLSEKLNGVVIDLGCGTGFLTQELVLHCENIDLIALDLAFSMLQTTRQKLGDSLNVVCADAENLPFLNETINTIFSNLALQWCQPIDEVLHELHRVLKSDGELIFSTFGSKTLWELKTAWKKVDDFTHVNEFYTPPELQNALKKAGFVSVEVKSQHYISRYDSVLDLMRELKYIGAHNVNSYRRKNLTSKKSLKTMMENYPHNELGEIMATFEVICIVARRQNSHIITP